MESSMKDYSKVVSRRGSYRISTNPSFETFSILAGFIGETDSVLDWGCGSCELGRFVRGQYAPYDPDDSNRKAVYHRKEELASLYDVLVAKDVIEHLTLTELEELFDLAERITRKRFIISSWLPNIFNISAFYSDLTHSRPYFCDDLFAILENRGFSILKIVVNGRHQNPVKLLITHLLNAGLDHSSPYYQWPFNNFIVVSEK
jgi:hypothetical protein